MKSDTTTRLLDAQWYSICDELAHDETCSVKIAALPMFEDCTGWRSGTSFMRTAFARRRDIVPKLESDERLSSGWLSYWYQRGSYL